MIDWLASLTGRIHWEAWGVIANLAVALVAVVGVGVAIWTARIPVRMEEARRRAEREQLASALVYEIRRNLANLKELRQAVAKQKVTYTSDFQDSIFIAAQREIADFGGDSFVVVSSFFAQLRNTNYLRGEFQKWEEKLLEGDISAGHEMGRIGNTLFACLDAAIHYGERALTELKPHASASAFESALPERFHTEEEKEILGLQ